MNAYTGGVLWDPDWENFVYVRHGHRIRLAVTHHLLQETVEGSLADLLEGDVVLSFVSKEAKARHGKFKERQRRGLISPGSLP